MGNRRGIVGDESVAEKEREKAETEGNVDEKRRGFRWPGFAVVAIALVVGCSWKKRFMEAGPSGGRGFMSKRDHSMERTQGRSK